MSSTLLDRCPVQVTLRGSLSQVAPDRPCPPNLYLRRLRPPSARSSIHRSEGLIRQPITHRIELISRRYHPDIRLILLSRADAGLDRVRGRVWVGVRGRVTAPGRRRPLPPSSRLHKPAAVGAALVWPRRRKQSNNISNPPNLSMRVHHPPVSRPPPADSDLPGTDGADHRQQ